MANAPQNYSGHHRRRRRRRKSPMPAIMMIAVLMLAIIIGVAACNHKKNKEESSIQSDSIVSESDALQESGREETTSEESSSKSEMTSSSKESESSMSSESSSVSSGSAQNVANQADDWSLVLVNAKNRLSGDYNVKLANVNANYQLDERIVEDMKAMIAAAKADGYSLQICSAYRSTERSAVLYKNKINQLKNNGLSDQDAAVEAAKWVAPPGTSEHNTGLAADIVSGDYFTKYSDLEHDFEKFDEFKWLYENCADYGFVLRYPKDKQEATGITYEPWHYRYVGKEHARKIMDQKICLEEYLNQF